MADLQNSNADEIFAIQNIFGKPPGWLVNWGISATFLFLVICLSIGAFVKYPDKLLMQAKLFSENPPVELLSKVNAEIDTIYKQDKDSVSKGDLVLQFRSTVNDDDLFLLKTFFLKIETVEFIPEYLNIYIPKDLNLGIMSSTYTTLVQQYEEFQSFLKQSAVFSKIRALGQEIEQIKKLNHSLLKQEEFYEKDVALTEKDFGRHSILRDQGVIADVEKEKAESKILNEKRNLEAFKSQRLNNEVRIEQLRTQISDLTGDRAFGVSTRILKIQQLKDQIISEMKEWEEIHIIKAPFDGHISHSKYLSKNQYVKTGDVLMICLPTQKGRSYVAQGKLPLKAAGTIKSGQKAILELENYPSAQFGVVEAKVSDISAIPNEDTYLVTLELPIPFITSYNKEIPQNQNLSASVVIQTKEYSLLERLFQNISDVIINDQK